MRSIPTTVILAAALQVMPLPAALAGSTHQGFRLEVLVDGRVVPEYAAYGTRYIEGLKGHEYAIRLHNPLSVRVAVALSVDGLNTIDARRTSARDARKWVLDPGETIVITGWQVSDAQARRFYFTSEGRSYARWLGATENIGIISAAFFRERARVSVHTPRRDDETPRWLGWLRAPSAAPRSEAQAPEAAASGAARNKGDRAGVSGADAPGDEYAATGIGRATDHPVELVSLDLEEVPAATLDLRYEFRPQLVALGIVPAVPGAGDPLDRRQRAKGFDGRFCPNPR